MANKVIRSNSVNQNFDVEYSVTKEKVGSSVAYKTLNPLTKLTITPRPGYVIDAKNFSTSSLPKEVESVVYTNESSDLNELNRVIANVRLKRDFVMPKDFVNIVLPIDGKVLKPHNKINLTFKTPNNENIIVSNVLNNKINFVSGSTSGTYHPGDKTAVNSYKFTGSGKTKITKMMLGTSSDNYFSNEPTCVINSKNKKNYKITTRDIRDNQKRLKTRIFNITYTFPKNNLVSNTDILTFNASTSVVKKPGTSDSYKREAPVIQAFNVGASVKKNGGSHPVSVVGTPGTKFKLLVQDDSQNILDASTGQFTAGGSFIQGKIPAKVPGQLFAVWSYILPIPKVTASREITLRLESESNSSHCGEPSTFTRIVNTNGILKPTIRQDIPITNRIGCDLTDTGSSTLKYSITNIPGTSSSVILVGPGVNRNPGDRVTATWIVGVESKSGTQGIVIARQPRFKYDATHAAWGAAHADTSKNLDGSTDTILMDWNISDNKSNKYTVSAAVKGLGAKTTLTTGGGVEYGRSTAFTTYQKVEITVTVHGVVYGTAAIAPELVLDNFLEIITGT